MHHIMRIHRRMMESTSLVRRHQAITGLSIVCSRASGRLASDDTMLLLMRSATLFSSVLFFSWGVTGAVFGLPLLGSSVRTSAVGKQRQVAMIRSWSKGSGAVWRRELHATMVAMRRDCETPHHLHRLKPPWGMRHHEAQTKGYAT